MRKQTLMSFLFAPVAVAAMPVAAHADLALSLIHI
mgnify:CR=1 FL=1